MSFDFTGLRKKVGIQQTPDGIGRFYNYNGGTIYWSAETGAHEVHGEILDKWGRMGWEQSFLGYPVTDELEDEDGRKLNHFQGGSIYSDPKRDVYFVTSYIINLESFRVLQSYNSYNNSYYVMFSVMVEGKETIELSKSVNTGNNDMNSVELSAKVEVEEGKKAIVKYIITNNKGVCSVDKYEISNHDFLKITGFRHYGARNKYYFETVNSIDDIIKCNVLWSIIFG